MRPLLVASVLVAAGVVAAAAQPRRSGVSTSTPARDVVVTAARIDRFAQWVKDVDQHEPGTADEALDDVASWSAGDLRGVWADARFLAALMRNPKLTRFSIVDRQAGTIALVYPELLLQRMRAMACAAIGRLAARDCLAIRASQSLDDELRRFADNATAARDATGDDNYLLRRAALLHADVEIILKPVIREDPLTRRTPGPHQVRADTSDGVSLNVREVGIHWEIGRSLLDAIKPKEADRPQPTRDPMVRDWYRATITWMQHVESHDTGHLDRGRELFPNDPDILFLSGTLHETYATPEIQAASRNLVMPTGFSMDIGSSRGELRQAEGFFRRAVERAPDMAEAHLRLGRVLGLQGHHADALTELQQALTLLADEELRYDGELFAGVEEEALGRYDAAAALYEQAAARYPGAQSPLIALSQLARRRGDRAGALAGIDRLFALPPPGDEGRADPWWVYK